MQNGFGGGLPFEEGEIFRDEGDAGPLVSLESRAVFGVVRLRVPPNGVVMKSGVEMHDPTGVRGRDAHVGFPRPAGKMDADTSDDGPLRGIADTDEDPRVRSSRTDDGVDGTPLRIQRFDPNGLLDRRETHFRHRGNPLAQALEQRGRNQFRSLALAEDRASEDEHAEEETRRHGRILGEPRDHARRS